MNREELTEFEIVKYGQALNLTTEEVIAIHNSGFDFNTEMYLFEQSLSGNIQTFLPNRTTINIKRNLPSLTNTFHGTDLCDVTEQVLTLIHSLRKS